jgi:uncharacterized protein (DUF1499 family)
MRRHLAAAAFLLLTACGRLEPGSVEPTAIPDPLTVERTWLPHDALVCPPRACAAEADRTAAVLAHAADAVLAAWRRMLTAEPRTAVIAIDPDRRLLLAQQASRLVGFIDTISVHVIPLGEGTSFAAYSRSEFGLGDMGVNAARLDAWQAAVEAILAGG